MNLKITFDESSASPRQRVKGEPRDGIRKMPECDGHHIKVVRVGC